MNASTFTARIIASTLADMHSAHHGGDRRAEGAAARRGQRRGDEDARGDRLPRPAAAYVRNRLARKEKIMGFGHAVYRTMDPRARILKLLSQGRGGTPRRPALVSRSPRPSRRSCSTRRSSYPNVDFYAASVLPHARHPHRPDDPDLRDRHGWPGGRRTSASSTRTTASSGPTRSTSASGTSAGSRSRPGPTGSPPLADGRPEARGGPRRRQARRAPLGHRPGVPDPVHVLLVVRAERDREDQDAGWPAAPARSGSERRGAPPPS